MKEQEIREILAEVDGLRRRADAISRVTTAMAWGMDEVSIEHTITIKRWPRTVKARSRDITLTSSERTELDSVLVDKMRELRQEADALAATLTQMGEE